MITSPAWRGKRFAVLGLARSGAATVRALVASGAEVLAWDSDEAKRLELLQAPPLQERQVNRAPRGSGHAGGMTDLMLPPASGRGV